MISLKALLWCNIADSICLYSEKVCTGRVCANIFVLLISEFSCYAVVLWHILFFS